MDPNERQMLDDLCSGVATLREHVEGMAANAVDRETVDRIATDVATLQAGLAAAQQRGPGFQPGDDDGSSERPQTYLGRDRFAQMLVRDADRVAAAIRRTPEQVRAFHEASDNLVLLATALSNPRTGPIDPRSLGYYTDEYLPAVRALDSTTAAEGDEFVPTLLSASLIDRVTLPLRVAALFEMIRMPSQPYDLPALGVSRVRGAALAENTADSGQTAATARTAATRKVTLTAVKFAMQMLVSKEATEDSLIPMLPFMQREIVDFIAADVEDTIINGDTTGTHQDSNVTDADDVRKTLVGLRKLLQSAAKTDASNAILTSAMLRINRKAMGKYGVVPGDLAHLVGMGSYINLLADSNLLTIDKYGPNATLVTGELARVDGSPIIVSEYVQQNLNASGVYDGSTTNRSVALTVNRRGYVLGTRRDLELQRLVETYARFDQDAIMASMRFAFAPLYTSTTELCVSAHYNVKPT